MLNSEQLQSLYNQGDYRKCLEEINLLLLFNAQDINALLLKGRCLYQIALNEAEPGDTGGFTAAASTFEEVLKLSPSNEEAMAFVAYINIFITRSDVAAAIHYCTQLAASPDPQVQARAIGYRQQGYCLTGNFDLALEDLASLVKLNREIYSNNLPALDQELGDIYFSIGKVYMEGYANHEKALEAFRQVLNHGHADFRVYCRIADIALDNGDYDAGGEAAILAFFADTQDEEERLALYHRLDELNRQGVIHQPVVKALFIGHRIFAEALGTDTTEMLNFTKQFIKIYPHWYVGYHYAGAALYDAGSYEAALPYLEKSLELGGNAFGLQRFIESAYHVNGELPVIKKWPDDHPAFYYNAGVNFGEFEEMMAGTLVAPELLKIRTEFYHISYEGFYDYFFNNKGKAGFAEGHIFAMCCNNYGIALSQAQEYEQAVKVHKLGYSISPFWEQSSSLGTALMQLGKYEEAIAAFNQALADGGNYLDFASYIELKGDILTANSNLGRMDEVKTLLERTEEEYNNFIRDHGAELSEEELFTLSERYITVQNARQDLLSNASTEDAIKAWQEQLEKYPDDNSAWFMLMQHYYQLKDYRQCIACANNYLSVKGIAIKPESSLKVYYMRGASYLNMEKYEQAKEDLSKVLNGIDPADESMQPSVCDANMFLAKCCYMLQQWEACKTYALNTVACYNNNGWKWDEACFATVLQYADACMATGEKQGAIGTVNTVLEMSPENQEALRRKKEWKSGSLFSSMISRFVKPLKDNERD
jgi:tetratricopeptide (TPR) repeat protein